VCEDAAWCVDMVLVDASLRVCVPIGQVALALVLQRMAVRAHGRGVVSAAACVVGQVAMSLCSCVCVCVCVCARWCVWEGACVRACACVWWWVWGLLLSGPTHTRVWGRCVCVCLYVCVCV
jgi:hypothetical protein